METPMLDPTTRLRLIERWLPLAQNANDHYGWQLDGPALEALIIAAAPALDQAPSTLAAQAVLWYRYRAVRPQP